MFEKKGDRMMKCPRDNSEMVKTAREGIEIDYCPECRGVWLERGELTKIIERSAAEWNERSGIGESKEGKEYPNFTDRQSRPGYESPGHFFGRLFDY
jgi:uncharacterized protein